MVLKTYRDILGLGRRAEMLTGVALIVRGPNHNFAGAGVFVVVVIVLILLIFLRVYGKRNR